MLSEVHAEALFLPDTPATLETLRGSPEPLHNVQAVQLTDLAHTPLKIPEQAPQSRPSSCHDVLALTLWAAEQQAGSLQRGLQCHASREI